MVRYENEQGRITVGFGHDEAVGYFISVYDTRLEVYENASEEFRKIGEGVSRDGTGCYLSKYTGRMGIGERVSYEMMVRLWRMYQVGEVGMKLIEERRPSF